MCPAIFAINLLGMLIFGARFVLSFLDPLLIERVAREVLRIEVERKIGVRIDTLSNTRIAVLAGRALQKTEVDMERTQAALREEVPRKVAKVIADMLNADCECRKRLIEHMKRSEEERLSTYTQVGAKLLVLIESAYASVTKSLVREFRIFSASNSAVFAILGMVTPVPKRATRQLILLAFALLGGITATAGIYLFNQNCLHTIVFGQYLGFAYSVYLAGVALLLSDVAFNRARVTTQIINAALNMVGATAFAVPC